LVKIKDMENIEGTVTIDLNKYQRLVEIVDKIHQYPTYNVYYFNTFLDELRSYQFLSNDEAIKLLINENKKLGVELKELLETKKITTKTNWFKRWLGWA
jgi:hypothetical protein